ncbi:receptor-type guanylate cyclase gcy-18-like isoform X3 [Contarinia nasturtii]|nr:receptor-type guanylate cyclase gcy-18-like isoform X3 [Contarinia nasturtii]XP_031629592.1 receptor-type guanylate cyclase gcy-18-like isoform X3 [Contarinia nasturtii]XP_031629593.1 receptor-type guanylate cyclase gcy-18-like isoform X3 [Contarinia nasturtii]XP_031629594.1 receptor-type guanylate cyclase gcy-18-like isoform X3 [Contarinia nasturtii]XP_031629595.1 receptor-type guanylate cyclase gcy-18-like isoform X3 [Contarinia nasturtii]XP_031629597.1 receptor-type guanylate cyclase gcy
MEMLWLWMRLLIVSLMGLTALRAEPCLSSTESQDTRVNLATYDEEIVIQVSNNVLHQISSHVFGILAKEILNRKIVYEDIQFPQDLINEREKLSEILDKIQSSSKPLLNLGVWMPPDYQIAPPDVNKEEMVGRFSTGRFGWFVPRKLFENDGASLTIPYTIFKNNKKNEFNRFIYDESILKQFKHDAQYIPDHCQNEKCVTLLSGHREDTFFVTAHIDELQLYVKIIWFGDILRYVTKALFNQLADANRYKENRKSFIIVYWTPSEIIDGDIDYETIIMPKCEQFNSKNSKDTMCKYELTPILKYAKCSSTLKHSTPVYTVLSNIYFERNNETYLLQLYNNLTDRHSEVSYTDKTRLDKTVQDDTILNNANNKTQLYDEIACRFIKENEQWFRDMVELPEQKARQRRKIYIGGIFPKKEEAELEHNGTIIAVELAQKDIEQNETLLPDIELMVISHDDGCHLDTVMRTFINYYVDREDVLGVLGPPCSESLQPIASLSKHIHMTVISYSAEGFSFKDREKYPYFFRTIGENRQYEHVYVKLFKELNWHRVVAFTEDGQKYTEYISLLENSLKENGIELTNKKFSKYFSPEKMQSSLLDLKNKNSNIIIADVYDEQAGVVLCEAFKLKMSAKHGYVWFLPIWVDKNSKEIYESENVNCTRDQIDQMLEGHFSLVGSSYAADETIMETNQTVGKWKEMYGLSNTSHYGGYAYDAVWVYALALDKLIKESPNYLATLNTPNTTERFVQILSESDFTGVSGRIQFGEGGSRFSTINVQQWVNNEHRLVAVFEPYIAESRVIQGGHFNFSASNIIWLTENGAAPTDGTNVCSVAGLANLLGYDCSQTMLIITALLAALLVILLSATSFIFWKRRYDQKFKASAKFLRIFGIDFNTLAPVHSNTLDKWEISKDRVVINRRLGEGAFGTVYGGEAQIDDHWTAVAVKTLKKGSNTEDRLDFLSEAEAMKRFDHSNIVRLLGVCLQSEPIYAIMEFMLYGDLKTYLLARRHLVNEKICDDSDISPKRLTMMALDVAKALSYLSEVKYVHRDVACRNCLVNTQRVVKLGDFGMARSTSENDYYRFSRKGMLPVRWMAPESLSLGKFTPASDIYSFGVLLYEIITFGSFPFQGMTNTQVLDYVKEGNTLTIPNGIKPALEGLMKACWSLSYIKRPTASEVVDFIGNYPKLVTASLDVPLKSVQIPETDSDQLELLPGLRKIQNEQTDEQEDQSTYINPHPHPNRLRIPNGITLSEFNAANDDYTISNPATPSITYNPIEPLLSMYDSGSNGSLRRYVPMCGVKQKKGNRALQMLDEHVV